MTGLLEKEFGRNLSEAFEMRQLSTYDVYAGFTKEHAKEMVQKAEQLVERARTMLNEGPSVGQ